MQISFGRPEAVACIKGRAAVPHLHGTVKFYRMPKAVLVAADICGFPESETGIFALHIHTGTDCGGEGFGDAMGHYDPAERGHPMHAGDLPPLFSCGGKAFLAVLTDRFRLSEVIGRTVVIHAGPDDLHSQPAGDSGKKIACGVIRAC